MRTDVYESNQIETNGILDFIVLLVKVLKSNSSKEHLGTISNLVAKTLVVFCLSQGEKLQFTI